VTANRRRKANPRGQGERLRTELVEAAGALLEELGAEKALSLRAVARRANVAPQSVYLHFTGLHELLTGVYVHTFADLVKHVRSAGAARTEPRDALRAVCMAYVEYAMSNPGKYRVLFATAGTPGRTTDEMPGLAALNLVHEVVTECRGGDDAMQVTICVWAALHGLVSLIRDRPSFPWPDHEQLVDRMLSAHVG
jgi:AcrR family transcriptional regulator